MWLIWVRWVWRARLDANG